MKRYYVAAGALLLGTSALAWAADSKMDASPIDKFITDTSKTADSAYMDQSWDKTATAGKSGDVKLASSDSSIPVGWTAKSSGLDTGAKLQTASDTSWSDKSVMDDGGKLQTAAVDTWSDAKGDTKLAMASTSSDKIIKTDDGTTGMGGPLEEVNGSSSLTRRLATDNYPPCSPGPGDDHCIQLYEPGVRAQLASWNQPTGGLADGSATTAMGGPYEPVETASTTSDDSMTMAAADTDATLDTGVTTDSSLAAHSDYEGMGGPIEAQSGYPPCSPGPGDDRCIQLYERGVTGAGN